MSWFPTTLAPSDPSWSFSAVGLLAVIGGSTIEKYKQPITASFLGGFPRILPAPTTLVAPDRPARLPSIPDVTILGVYSGNKFTELNYFADVIHNIGSLAPYEFRVYNIEYTGDIEKRDSKLGGPGNQFVSVPVRLLCPLNFVTVISIAMTAGLLIWAGVIHDGVALVGLGTMALSTSTACLSSLWYPKLSHRAAGAGVPPGDIVMKTRGGAFVVVHCPEEITRELYGGMDTCHYAFNGRPHQLLLASSTILLMAAIIFLSNAGRTMQIAIGVAYIILNMLYWAIAVLTSEKQTWDMRRYNVELVKDKPSGQSNYTETLSYAIQETGEIDWVVNGGLAPSTKYWMGWLNEAKANCNNPNWDGVAAKDRWMDLAKNEQSKASKEGAVQRETSSSS
ncbi:hypothetical protein PHISCL_06625 [Aspergillus sclerotialis]|uniref:Uncharacterized protein n=1 Tax=Aspergillus sclerotialis TaxID=2070753 RepID=A0A3A2ZEK3_9EURO|nr:hypothetical protein PHISCL_06625 [Aspergillus sclerotialis]